MVMLIVVFSFPRSYRYPPISPPCGVQWFRSVTASLFSPMRLSDLVE
jgi:hypothetical protein